MKAILHMKTPAQLELEMHVAHMKGLLRSAWLCFIAGAMLAFALGYMLGRMR